MKTLKKIISIVLIVSLTIMNTRLDFPIVTEYNETVAVDETIQLRIPGGATDIEWESTSKRIAKVSFDGKVTGVKVGTCDVNCRAEYSKFIFFKDVVNYVFHIKVIDGDNSEDNNLDILYDDNYVQVYYELFIKEDVTNANSFKPEIIKKGEAINQKEIPMSKLCQFADWYLDINGKEKYVFGSPIEHNTILYAKWEIDDTDTDGDGLIDVVEINKYQTSINEKDTDSDGLSDYVEVKYGLNPLLKDSNGDGVDDYNSDLDEDGLKNGDEIINKTEMNIMDTDNDGLSDNDEIKKYKTNPTIEDTDSDGATDGWEIENGFDPLTFNSTFDIKRTSGTVNKNSLAIEVSLTGNGKTVESLTLMPLDSIDTYMASPTVPGYMGYMYDISADGDFNGATLSFSYDVNTFGEINDNFEPRVYYVNEEEGTYELLPNQIVENGKVTAKVSHFSKYILLNKKEFDEVWNSNIKSPIANNNRIDGLDIAIVLDSSGSMADNDYNNIRINVGEQIIDKLNDADNVGIIDFDSKASILCPLTNDKNNAKKVLKNIDSAGGTLLSAGLDKGIETLKELSNKHYKMMFFLTDGKDGNKNKGVMNAIISAVNNNIVINTVGLGNDIDEKILIKIANETGGNYYFAEQAIELPKIANEIIDYITDSNNDGISDYYTELIYKGEMPGADTLFGIDLNKHGDDYDNDGLKNGEEIEIKSQPGQEDKPYVKILSNPIEKDTDMDAFFDNEEKSSGSNIDQFDRRYEQLRMFLEFDDKGFTYNEPNLYDAVSRFVKGAGERKENFETVLSKYFSEYCNDSYIYNELINEKKIINDYSYQYLSIVKKEYNAAKKANDEKKMNEMLEKYAPLFEAVVATSDIREKLLKFYEIIDLCKENKFAVKIKPFDLAFDTFDALEIGTMAYEDIKCYINIRSNLDLINNNIVLIDALIHYAKVNKYEDMVKACESTKDAVEKNIKNMLGSLGIKYGKVLVKKIIEKKLFAEMPFLEFVAIMKGVIDVSNSIKVTGKAFENLSISDKVNVTDEFMALSIFNKMCIEKIESYSEIVGNYYVLGKKNGGILDTDKYVKYANSINMHLVALIQSRILQINNPCSKFHVNRIGKLQQVKMMVNQLRLPINESLYNKYIPDLYITKVQ